ncbi:hypothetical protein FIE12Z_1307 [Fusarium flagelliforme]|uniref:Heterokaryon incompatibility domain-containing protein n=1 Tax=Fusarium flagelliforme TaxID=2675880 RepID=A0A395N234_9HYPO|nr:hypothetical protein FIE12Z_1307 [Fusarium flagelliforme]
MWFQYPEKLDKDSLRIFTLEPGEEKDTLHGSLVTHRLDAAPEYEALSYEWGNKNETTYMKCNNYDFKITKSLNIYLAPPEESYDERSAQVSIMKLIYSNATMVTAWLGPADTEATNSVKRLLTAFSNLTQWSGEMKHFPDDHHLAELNLPRRDSRTWKDLNLMLGASYFSRVWIIQELAVSSKFQLLWGDIVITEDEYESLKNKILFLSLTETDAKKDCPRIIWNSVALTFLDKRKWDDKDLFELVRWASECKATIQQDKIYALIGLSGQRNYNVEPDYAKSESEVFADFARRVISTNENLNVLDYAYVGNPNERNRWPFWAPRWQPEDNTAGFVQNKFKASKDTKTITKPSLGANVLGLRGLEVDVVRDVLHRVPEVHQDIEAALELVENHKDSFEQIYTLDPIKVIILTMMAGREVDVLWGVHYQRPKDESYLDNFITYAALTMKQNMQAASDKRKLFNLVQLAFEARSLVAQDEPQIGDTSEEHPDNPEYISLTQEVTTLIEHSLQKQGWYRFHQATTVSQDLNFFITEKSYVGVGPRCMKAGDKVCILFGGSTPYVIRPTSIPDEYLYLGPAYVHGIMDGEVIDAWEKDKNSSDQEFQEKLFKLL